MAQFDVRENRGPNRFARPFVVLLQSARFDRFDRRLVAPLARLTVMAVPRSEITPHLVVAGETMALLALELTSVEAVRLGPFIASIAVESGRIIAAIDEVIATAYG